MRGDFSVVGHRGWPNRFPENTLVGCIAAAEVADAIELDVRRCGDGKLVLSHDPVLGGLPVAETSWATLSDIDLGDGHHPALLDEVLAALPDTPVQMEVKNWPGEPGFEPDHRLALETAERTRPGDIVTGFNPDSLAVVRRSYGNVTTGLCIPGGVAFSEGVNHCLNAGHEILVAEFSLITEALNVPVGVFAWTVNDLQRARELVELGVTGIITDDPGLITTLRE